MLPPVGVGTCALLQKASEQVAECLRGAAEAEARAEATIDAKIKAEYQRIADTWRTLSHSYEFQGSLGRFISFNESRKKALPFVAPSSPQIVSPAELQTKPDFLASHLTAWFCRRGFVSSEREPKKILNVCKCVKHRSHSELIAEAQQALIHIQAQRRR